MSELNNTAVAKTPEIDTTGWTKYGPTECECISAKIGMVSTRGGMKHRIILTLVDLRNCQELLYFLSTTKNKSGYSVKRNSNFAKLYRLTIGENPTNRFSKSQQLMEHLVGEEFLCEYESARSSKGHNYYKVTDIKSAYPYKSAEWLPDGTSRKRKGTKAAKRSKKRNLFGNHLDKNSQTTGNQLEIENSEKSCHKRAQRLISLPDKPTDYKLSAYTPTNSTTDINVMNKQETVFTHHRISGETDEQYLDRVIDESLSGGGSIGAGN